MDTTPFYHATAACAGERFDLDLQPWEPDRAMTRPHWHTALEINFVRRGRGQYLIGGRNFPIRPRTVFVIPAGVPHQTVTDPREPHWNLTLYFRPQAVAPLGRTAVDTAAAVGICVRRLPAGSFSDLWEHLMDGLERERQHDGGSRSLTAAAKILDACLLVQRCAAAAAAAAESAPAPARLEYIRRMLEFIDDHLAEAMTLKRIAAHVGLNPNYASGLFHQVTGTTLFTYITGRRLHRARQLLASTDQPVAEVARRCGFVSVPTFYRHVRAAYGATPAALRQLAAAPLAVIGDAGAERE